MTLTRGRLGFDHRPAPLPTPSPLADQAPPRTADVRAGRRRLTHGLGSHSWCRSVDAALLSDRSG